MTNNLLDNDFEKKIPVAAGMRTKYCGTISADDIDKEVVICGWVNSRREHGEHLAFLDIRDHTGVIQCVVDAKNVFRSETVVKIKARVRRRPEGTSNESLATGEVELFDCELTVLSEAAPLPFAIDGHHETDEQIRLRYRYLDLRRERMQYNLRLRAKVISAMRRAMEEEGFLEVETPLLWTPTPEGAREFAIPSRLQPGCFYVLPQSPQIAKQLLMVGGFDRYFQVARCLRDEDLRADRQFEFTQLDLEASFIDEEDIRSFVTKAVIDATTAATGEESLQDYLSEIPIFTWREAMERFGSDKPDLRIDTEIVDLGKGLEFTSFKAFQAESVKGLLVKKGACYSRSKLDQLIERAKALGAKGLVWMKVIPSSDDDEAATAGDISKGSKSLESPIVKFLSSEEVQYIIDSTSAEVNDLVLIMADSWKLASSVLGQLRIENCPSKESSKRFRFCWIKDFPMFEGLDEDGNLIAAHHPFTMPHEEDMDLMDRDPLRVRAKSYDLVLNGWELGSGSIRIHRSDIQAKVFTALGISEEEAEQRFGFLLKAFSYGAPPHGGFAIGIDRLVAILAGEDTIREVIAFPKTQSGTDLLTGAPKQISLKQLRELNISVKGK